MPGGEVTGFRAIAQKFVLTGGSSMLAEGATCAPRPPPRAAGMGVARRPADADARARV